MQFGPGFLPTFLYYFAGTALFAAIVLSRSLHVSPMDVFVEQVSLAVGLTAGLLGGYFNRTTTIEIEFKNQAQFLKKLNRTMQELGYQPVEQTESDQADQVFVYERSRLAKWLYGKVYVHLESKKATIASRFVDKKRLSEQL